jgi:protein phosphatase
MDSENIQNNDNVERRLIRLVRPSIVVLCGPAGCGKSTFAEKHFRPTQVISSDWARGWICDDDRDQRFNSQAFALVHFLVDQRLLLNRLCVVDSTALTVQARKELLELAKKFQVPATLMYFKVPLETCLERDEKRERTVGRAVIERQYQAFEQVLPTLQQEGFDQVIELNSENVDKVQIEILFRPAVRAVQRAPRSEVLGSRRFERSHRFVRPRTSEPGGNGHSRPATSAPLTAAPLPASQPVQPPGAALSAKEAPLRTTATLTAATGPKPHLSPTSSPPVKADGTVMLTPPGPPLSPVRPTAPRPATVNVDSAGSN